MKSIFDEMKKFIVVLFFGAIIAACVQTSPPAPLLIGEGGNASETAFFAGVHATQTAQVATLIAIPVATPRPRTPTVSPTPGVTFRFDQGVSEQDRKEIQDATAIARKYLGDVYNVTVYAFSDLTCVPENPDSTEITCPNVRGNLGIATGNLLELNLAVPSWKNSRALRYSVVAHEYAHIVQNYSSSKQAATPLMVGFGPIWLIEGGADYLSSWVIASEKIADYGTLRTNRLEAVKKINAPLQSVEDRMGARLAGGGSEYTLGWLGTEFLARNFGGEQNVLKFYRATAAAPSWHAAFQQVFGISREEFYEKFEEYRKNNFPLNR